MAKKYDKALVDAAAAWWANFMMGKNGFKNENVKQAVGENAFKDNNDLTWCYRPTEEGETKKSIREKFTKTVATVIKKNHGLVMFQMGGYATTSQAAMDVQVPFREQLSCCSINHLEHTTMWVDNEKHICLVQVGENKQPEVIYQKSLQPS